MASYSELLETCSQFQSNFALLNGKYTALQAELTNERAKNSELHKELESEVKRSSSHEETIRNLKREISDLQSLRHEHEMTLVNLQMANNKNERLERNAQDAVLRHKHEVAQLHDQIKHWSDKVDCVNNVHQVEELQRQILSLQEESALLKQSLQSQQVHTEAQLSEANNALHEEQKMNKELVAKCQNLNNEVKELRVTLTKSAELQRTAIEMKEKKEHESFQAKRQVHELEQSLQNAERQLHMSKNEHRDETERLHKLHEKDHHTSEVKITKLIKQNSDLQAKIDECTELNINLQRNIANNVNEAKMECNAELTALQAALRAAKEEVSTLNAEREKWKLQLCNAQDATQVALHKLHNVEAELETRKEKQMVLLEQAKWSKNEQQRVELLLERAEYNNQRLQEEHDKLQREAMELKRVKRMLLCSNDENKELKHLLLRKDAKLTKMTLVMEKKIKIAEKENKRYKMLLEAQTAKADALREQLVEKLMSEEARLCDLPWEDRHYGASCNLSPHHQCHYENDTKCQTMCAAHKDSCFRSATSNTRHYSNNSNEKNNNYFDKDKCKHATHWSRELEHTLAHDVLPMHDDTHFPTLVSRPLYTSSNDVIKMLKGQTAQAEHLHRSLQSLSAGVGNRYEQNHFTVVNNNTAPANDLANDTELE